MAVRDDGDEFVLIGQEVYIKYGGTGHQQQVLMNRMSVFWDTVNLLLKVSWSWGTHKPLRNSRINSYLTPSITSEVAYAHFLMCYGYAQSALPPFYHLTVSTGQRVMVHWNFLKKFLFIVTSDYVFVPFQEVHPLLFMICHLHDCDQKMTVQRHMPSEEGILHCRIR